MGVGIVHHVCDNSGMSPNATRQSITALILSYVMAVLTIMADSNLEPYAVTVGISLVGVALAVAATPQRRLRGFAVAAAVINAVAFMTALSDAWWSGIRW